MENILIIGSSVRQEDSKSNLVVDVIESELKILGLSPSVWKIGYKPLPLAQHAWHKNPSLSNDENVIGLASAIDEANIIILVSPIYNGSYSGALKNALDCMLGDAFDGKRVALFSMGSDSTAILPCLHLQDVARTMDGEVYHRFTVVSSNKIDLENRVIDDEINSRIKEILEDLTR